VGVDVRDRLLDGVDDPDGEDQGQELGVPVLLGRVSHRPGQRLTGQCVGAPVDAQLDAGLAQGAEHPRQEGRRHVRVDEQRLRGIAHAGTLGLGVQHDPLAASRSALASTKTWQLPDAA
jgi:hypothetical protein